MKTATQTCGCCVEMEDGRVVTITAVQRHTGGLVSASAGDEAIHEAITSYPQGYYGVGE